MSPWPGTRPAGRGGTTDRRRSAAGTLALGSSAGGPAWGQGRKAWLSEACHISPLAGRTSRLLLSLTHVRIQAFMEHVLRFISTSFTTV